MAGLARWVVPVWRPEAGAVADCACSADRPTDSTMSVAMLVFIVFSFYSLRPAARLGHEAVDEAVESERKLGRGGSGQHIVRLACWQPMVALGDWRVVLGAASF